MIDILLGIPSPFDFPLVEKYQKYITDYDKIIPRYYEEINAYKIMVDFFLRGNYTHLAFASSDVVIQKQHIDMLYKDLKEKDHPVITGMMNISLENFNLMNITKDPIDPQHNGGFLWYDEKQAVEGEPLKQVGFSGFPLMVLRRDVVKEFGFQGIRSYFIKNHPEIHTNLLEGALDTVLCWKLFMSGIPIIADTRVRLLHLKQLTDKSETVLTGQREPITMFCPRGGLAPYEICRG